MAVERTNFNGVVARQSERVTNGNNSNRKQNVEYRPIRVYSVRERKLMIKAMFNSGINWDRAKPGFNRVLDKMRNTDLFNYQPVLEAFNEADQQYRVTKAIEVIQTQEKEMSVEQRELVLV